MTFIDVLSRKLSEVSQVSATVGIFMTMTTAGLARVNVQGSTVDIRCDGWSPPVPSMPVRVETVDGIMRVTGPSRPLPARAEVVATSDGATRATVIIDGVGYTLPVMAPYSPIVTDFVIINWVTGHILGEEAAAPAIEEPPPIGPGGSTFTDLLIQPFASGKYDTDWNNWWGGAEVWASNNNYGIWAYAGRFGALAGATITQVEIYLPLISAIGTASIGLHDQAFIPGGGVSITNLTGLPNRNGWVSLPAEWGNHLRDNPTHGIGVTSGAGLNKWRGVGQDGQSGWLRFAGTR